MPTFHSKPIIASLHSKFSFKVKIITIFFHFFFSDQIWPSLPTFKWPLFQFDASPVGHAHAPRPLQHLQAVSLIQETQVRAEPQAEPERRSELRQRSQRQRGSLRLPGHPTVRQGLPGEDPPGPHGHLSREVSPRGCHVLQSVPAPLPARLSQAELHGRGRQLRLPPGLCSNTTRATTSTATLATDTAAAATTLGDAPPFA